MVSTCRLLPLLALLAAHPALAAEATGAASATVVAPLVVEPRAPLDFGIVATGARGGRVTVGSDGAVRREGDARPACEPDCPPPQPARFRVRGEPGRRYTVSLPARLTIAGPGGATLEVTRFEAAGAMRLDSSGEDGFTVGGTLEIPADAPPARHTVTVPVTVDYG